MKLRSAVVTFPAVLVLIACGGSTDNDLGPGGTGGAAASGGSGAQAGSGGGGSGGTAATGGSGGTAAAGGSGGSGALGGSGGSGGIPNECQVPVSEPGPYPVKFRFTNQGATPLYVLSSCRIQYSVTDCASSYQSKLSLFGDCTVDCSDQNAGCIACGACMYQGVPVTIGAPAESDWSGNTFTFDTTAQGCSCHNQHVAPAGKYRVSVPVYDSDQAAQNGKELYVAQIDFVLPAPGGVVEVPLAAQASPDSP